MALTRPQLVRRGQQLQYFTIAYNSIEGIIAILAGLLAGSVALVGFGIDSAIEVTSGIAALWRLHADVDEQRRAQVEKIMLRIVGLSLVALAVYVGLDAVRSLVEREAADESIVGISLAAFQW